MRDEQYYALANLVKRPMRRWWAKVGSWWMAGLGVLLVAYDLDFLLDPLAKNSYGSTRIGLDLLGDLSFSASTLSVGIALLAAINVIVVIDQIAKDSLAFNEPELRVHKFKLALFNCWPALLPPFLWSFFYNYVMFHMDANFVLLQAADSIQTPLLNTTWVVWLVAFAIVCPGNRWPTWALYIGVLLSSCGFGFFPWIRFNSLGIFSYSSGIDFSNPEHYVFEGVGLLLVYGIFYLFLMKRNLVGSLLCVCYSIIALLSEADVRIGVYFADYIIQAGRYLLWGLVPFSVESSLGSELVLGFRTPGYMQQLPASPALAIVPVLSGIFWVLAHYFAFSLLMRRDWGKRGSRFQVKG